MNEARVFEARPLQRGGLWLRKTDDEVAVYDREGGRVHLMNDSALAIWDLCDGETTADEMVAAICELFRMHPDVVTEDVTRTLQEFDQAGLLSWVPPPGG